MCDLCGFLAFHGYGWMYNLVCDDTMCVELITCCVGVAPWELCLEKRLSNWPSCFTTMFGKNLIEWSWLVFILCPRINLMYILFAIYVGFGRCLVTDKYMYIYFGCVRLASPGRSRCVAFFFPGRTCSWKIKPATHRGRPREAKTNAPIVLTPCV